MLKRLLFCVALAAATVGLANAAVNDARIVGKWDCVGTGWPSATFIFNADKTWTDGEQSGDYWYYGDSTKYLVLHDRPSLGVMPVVTVAKRKIPVETSARQVIVWGSNIHFSWDTSPYAFQVPNIYDCKKKS